MKVNIQSYRVTILTPIYNRAGYLRRVYDSLRKQLYINFEWLIVDDGSTDDTRQVVETLIANSTCVFPIRYFYKENGGKHTAINVGVKEAKGELLLILDSDDTLPIDALDIVVKYYAQCNNKADCGGVCGLMAHHDGTMIGSGFPTDTMYERALNFRYRGQVKGDLMEVFKISVLREYPFPEIPNERFCPEALVWNRIAKKYKLLCFNKVVYYRDYLKDGLTSKIIQLRMKSPIAATMTYAEMLDYDISLKWKMRSAINYWRFKVGIGYTQLKIPKVKWYWKTFLPLGWMMHLNDKRING